MSPAKDLYSRWAQRVRRSGLVRPGERIGVAVSGGADSVLLLVFMKKLAAAMGLVVSAVHFNHRLRGEESDKDERFVSELAARLGMEFIRAEGEVARRSKEQKRNVEATAREMRYRYFFSLVRAGRLNRIATAHTANDQAETVLLHLLRGTGTRGLGGIHPVLDGVIVRPFLGVTRVEVEAELRRQGLTYRVDSSNLDTRFRRNKIRHELMPCLQRDFNPHIISTLAGLADRAREDEEYLRQQAHDRAAPWRMREGQEEKFPVRPLAELPRALAFRVIRQMLLAVKGHLLGFTHQHVDSVYRLATEAQSGRRLILPGNVEVRREFDWLVVGPQLTPPEGEFSITFRAPRVIELPEMGVVLRFKIVEGEAVHRAYNDEGTVCLDAGKLASEVELRSWHAGDHFKPLSARKSLKVKELFRRQRIGVTSRRRWPLLVKGEEIVWVRGFPVAGSVAPGKNTRALLTIREEPLKAPRVTKRLR